MGKMMNSESTGTTVNEVSLQKNESVSLSEMVLSREAVTAGDSSKEMVSTIGGMPVIPIEDVLTRNVLIATGDVTSSDTLWANQFGSSLDPMALWLGNTLVQSKIDGYARFRGDMEVTLVVNPPANAYGAYCFAAVCEGGVLLDLHARDTDADPDTNDNPYTATQDIHGVINISMATTVTLRLPFVYPVDAIDFLNTTWPVGAPMYRLALWAWAPIQNSLGADPISATYKLYARVVPGYQLSVAVSQAKGGVIMKSKTTSISTGATGANVKPAGKMGKFAANVAKAAGIVGAAVPFLAPFAGPLAVGAGVASQIADMFGFTRESDVSTPSKVIGRPFSSLPLVDGEDTSEVVAMMRDNTTTIDPRIGGGIESDPTAFADLFPRWTLIGSADWAYNTDVDTNLMNIPVTPGICAAVLGIRYPTVCAYVGMPFQFWRGGMEYMVYVPTSPFHRGTLQIAWDPDTTNTLTPDITNKVANVIFDTTVDDAMTLTVGYAQVEPCKRMSLCSISTPHSGSDFNNGVLRIYVHSKLQAPVTTASVSVLVFARARQDMRFGIPATKVYNALATDRIKITTAMQNQGGIGDDDESESHVVNLVGDGELDRYPIGAVCWGEDFQSVRPLLQKFSLAMIGNGTADQTFADALPHVWPPRALADYPYVGLATPLSTTVPVWTWFGHYSQMYVGIRGSARWKIVDTTSDGTAAYTMYSTSTWDLTHNVTNYLFKTANPLDFATLGTPAGPAAGSTHMPIQVPQEGCCEFLLPYYGNSKFESSHHIRNPGLLVDAGWSDRWDVLGTSVGESATKMIFYAGGPDVAPVRFRRVPAMKYS
jgi:hypothetical protein